jgi:hypothetical protein
MSQLQKLFNAFGTDITEEEKDLLTGFYGDETMISDAIIEEITKTRESGGDLNKLLNKYAVSFNEEVMKAKEMSDSLDASLHQIRDLHRKYGGLPKGYLEKVAIMETELLKIKIRIREIENFQKKIIKFSFKRSGYDLI